MSAGGRLAGGLPNSGCAVKPKITSRPPVGLDVWLAMASQSEAVRFSHLLEPIRDLAQNWSIDIASELEEYLTELEEITISFDDGVELDFAEAALVIQGSAVIYSKKVEHLYTLVYNMINQVVEKKRAAEEAAQRRRSRGDTADAEDEEEEGDFTALDDTLKEVGNISLPATAATTGTSRSITLASAPVGMLPQPGGGGGGEGGNMQGSRLHPSGALLLPHLVLPTHVLAALPSPSLTLGSAPSLDLPAPPPPPDAAEGGAGDDDDDDGDMGMPDMGDGDEGWTAALGASPPSFDGGGGGAEPASPTPMSVARTPLSGVGNKKVEAPAAAVWDPWAPLDPHDSSGAARRPFRKGATYSAPPPLDGPGAAAGAAPPEKESACAAGVAEGPWGGGVLAKVGLAPSPTATAVPAAASPTSIMSAMRAPLWEQFEEMHAAEAQRRAAARKKHRLVAAQRAHVPSADADAAEIEAGDIVREADVPAAAAAEVAAEVDYEDGPIGFDNDDDGGFGGVFEAAEMGEAADASADGSQLGGSTAPFAGFGSEGGGAAGAEAGSSTYEDLCRAHVESCLEASSS